MEYQLIIIYINYLIYVLIVIIDFINFLFYVLNRLQYNAILYFLNNLNIFLHLRN